MSYKYRILLAIPLLLMVTLFVPVMAAWDYTKTISDATGDSSGPSYTDIIQLVYAYNSTHISTNITYAANVPSSASSTVYYEVYFDTDNNPNTGYQLQLQYGSVLVIYGVEYRVELSVSSLGVSQAVLWKYSGGSWTPVSTPYSSVNGNEVDFIIKKSDFNGDLGSQITLVSTTEDSNHNTYDWTEQLTLQNPLPVPETWLFATAGIVAAGVFVGLTRKSLLKVLRI